MQLKIILSLISFTLVSATLPKFEDANDIAPEDVGLYHTEAFEQLSDLYASKKPGSLREVMKDMTDVVASYCIGYKCIRSVRRSAFERFNFGIRHMNEAYPEDYDPVVKEHLESIEALIRKVDDDGVDEVVGGLVLLQDDLRDKEGIAEEQKSVGLAAGSMAIESTKLWMSVDSDPNHPLRSVRGVQAFAEDPFDRHLQQLPFDFDIQFVIPTESGNVGVILADVLALIVFVGFPIPAIFASLLANIYFGTTPPTSAPSAKPSAKPSARPV